MTVLNMLQPTLAASPAEEALWVSFWDQFTRRVGKYGIPCFTHCSLPTVFLSGSFVSLLSESLSYLGEFWNRMDFWYKTKYVASSALHHHLLLC